MNKILKAILAGKSKSEVMDLLSDEDKAMLDMTSKMVGMTRQQRRKLMRKK
ncbi:hypothetical protein ACIXT2_17810 [Bacteroides fragilis]|jgi:hypothetical protein